MEACIANLLEPGETIVVGNNGIWGARVVDMAGRFGGALLACPLHTSHDSHVFVTNHASSAHASACRCPDI